MSAGEGNVEVYEKTSVELSYSSVVRFTGHVQLKGLSERTVESYVCMIRQLAAWGKRDPAELTEEQVRDYFLYLVRERKYAPASLRQARASLGCFYLELLGRTDWKVFSLVKTKERERLPVVLSRGEMKRIFEATRSCAIRSC
jgi:site-specific recombinase XerD